MLWTGIRCLAWLAPVVSAASDVPSAFTVPGAFPTSVFTKYYNAPTGTSEQVQPVVSDPVTVRARQLTSQAVTLQLKLTNLA